ncbi:hypothetical protein JCM19992_19130 [Thermostilla marina]
MPRWRMLAFAALWLVASWCGCSRPVESQPTGLVLVRLDQLPADPSDEAWQAVPTYEAELLLQDMVDPRLTEPSVKTLHIQAATDGTRIAFRLRWDDPTENTRSLIDAFPDACAVQMPAEIGPSIPAPQMGEPGRPVKITYWNAAWQVQAQGSEPTLHSAYPNATVDHYPFTAPSLPQGSPPQQAMARRYSPARAVGNPVAPPHLGAVQDLIAEGPGTLTAASETLSEGQGIRSGDQWVVMLVRPLPEALLDYPQPQVAFAVWEGSHQEFGARKMRTAWLTMTPEGSAP